MRSKVGKQHVDAKRAGFKVAGDTGVRGRAGDVGADGGHELAAVDQVAVRVVDEKVQGAVLAVVGQQDLGLTDGVADQRLRHIDVRGFVLANAPDVVFGHRLHLVGADVWPGLSRRGRAARRWRT